jgi:uncharacterized protein (DUF924 family)
VLRCIDEHAHHKVADHGRIQRTPAHTRNKAFEGHLDDAIRHRDIITHFGRFPHRNRILERESTAEELAFLEQPGSAF